MNLHDNNQSGVCDSKTNTAQFDAEPANTSQRKESSASSDLSLDAIFDILSYSCRRQILSYLLQTEDGLATVADLVAFVSKHESENETRKHPTQDDALNIALRHNHLPKLADAGVIEFDTRSETIQYQAHPNVEKYLSVIDARERNTI